LSAQGKCDHLFISYATEDVELAEWLALKLTAEGYRVWWDRLKLLGGESYVEAVDHAIKSESFRVLALLSRHSLHKDNPRRERTLALNLQKERGEFLIPLNVDGLTGAELNWMTVDITFIPFHTGWASGFAQLLDKLQAVNTPRPIANGRGTVCDWFAARAGAKKREERLWGNLLPITELPKAVYRYDLETGTDLDAPTKCWSFFRQSPTTVWAFSPPPEESCIPAKEAIEVTWQDQREHDGLLMRNVATYLLRRCVLVRCTQKGMAVEQAHGDLYYPPGLLPDDRLYYTRYDGRRTYVNSVGERTFKSAAERTKNRYHLSPDFYPVLTAFGDPVFRVSIRLYLTDLEGNPIDANRMQSRRKGICRSWWNYQWLSRVTAVVDWLSGGKQACELVSYKGSRLAVSGRLLNMRSPWGIEGDGPLAEAEEEMVEVIDEQDYSNDWESPGDDDV
jgi:hypothetical protein